MVIRRKKDHGRAEAMLIAAWGLGMRITADNSAPRVWQHVFLSCSNVSR